MEHLIYRCQHCNKEYTYCTYGNGPNYGTEEGCTREYCSECANIIKNALSKIPIKYEGRLELLDNSRKIDIINTIFDKCREDYNNDTIIKSSKVLFAKKYIKMEGCYIDKVEYRRCTKENGDIDIFVKKEYDLINQKFTGKNYFENNNPHRQYFSITILRFDNILVEKKLEEPIGKMFFNDFEWTINTKEKND